MDYLPTLGEKWPHSRGNVGKYSHPMEHLGLVRGGDKFPPQRVEINPPSKIVKSLDTSLNL